MKIENQAARIPLKPWRVAWVLGLGVGFLVSAHVAGLVSKYALGHGQLYGLVPLFSVNVEQNVPTLYSTVMLLICAALLAVIAHAKHAEAASDRGYWLGLLCVFLFLAIDEFVMIHERFDLPFREKLHLTGLLYFAWVLPYGLLVLTLGLLYLRFVLRLPPRTRTLVILAGALYVGGALLGEALGAAHIYRVHEKDLVYEAITLGEESGEMTGLIVFIYALLAYIQRHYGTLRLTTEPPQ